jgi:hypothetical protein
LNTRQCRMGESCYRRSFTVGGTQSVCGSRRSPTNAAAGFRTLSRNPAPRHCQCNIGSNGVHRLPRQPRQPEATEIGLMDGRTGSSAGDKVFTCGATWWCFSGLASTISGPYFASVSNRARSLVRLCYIECCSFRDQLYGNPERAEMK